MIGFNEPCANSGLFQLSEAEEILKNATKAWRDYIEIVRQECATFQEKQTDIDSRLLTIMMLDTNDEAARKFEAGIESLRKLDVAQGYMDLLYHVYGLRFAFFHALNWNLFTHLAIVRRLWR